MRMLRALACSGLVVLMGASAADALVICASKLSGNLSAAEECKNGETPLTPEVLSSLGLLGPQGPTGPAGPAGPAGDVGPAGPLVRPDLLEQLGCN